MVSFDRGSMVAAFPECSLLVFPLVEFLSCTTCDQLHRPGNNLPPTAIEYEQMDMIGSNHVIEDLKPVAFFDFKQPSYPGRAVLRELEQKLSFVTSVGNTPRVSRKEAPFCPGHAC